MSVPLTRWFSLRRRLLALLLGGVTIGWFAAMGLVYHQAYKEIDKLQNKEVLGGKIVRDRLQRELEQHFVEGLLPPLLFGLPILGVWIWFATRRSLAPLDLIAAEIVARAPDRLDPVLPATAPTEIRLLLEAVNTLFGRVAEALDSERRFTADSAHELRTPLAAILAQADVAQHARDAAERDHALAQIAASSRRAGRLVEQLLTLARLDPTARLPLQAVRLDELAVAVCADHGATALDNNIALELDAPAAVVVMGDFDLLRVLLRNLLDNALRYTPAGGKVGVGVTANRLTVIDNGPGIPPEERANVLRRFHRLAGQAVEGSGLGLSIVARIVELHGAQLALDAAGGDGGLAVCVDFPDAAPTP